MARSLFLKDGSTKLIFHEDDQLTILAGLIQEYLGKDCEELFYSIFEDKYANTGDDYERIADGYLSMLRDILDELDAILLCFNAARLDRRKVYSNAGITCITTFSRTSGAGKGWLLDRKRINILYQKTLGFRYNLKVPFQGPERG